MDRQMRITDLVPQRYRVFALWFAIGAAVIGGLEALYHYMPRLGAHASDGRIAAFDLDGEGSLGAWFSSFSLGLAACLSLIILSVRRQRDDDYHGRYRVWFWAALLFFVMSVDECASLHEGFKEMMTGLTGYRLAGDGSLWWVLAYGLFGGVIGLRMVLDLRRCRAALTFLGLTAACYLVAVVVQLEWLLPERGAQGVMVEEGLEMGGNLLLLIGLGLYARYAMLEVQGLIPLKEKTSQPRRQKEQLAAESATPPGKPRAAEAPGPAAQPVAASTSKPAFAVNRSDIATPASGAKPDAGASHASAGRVDEADAPRPHQRLSKAERRALRRQQQSQRYDDDE